ncbi:MAG: alanine racemase [Sedimentisphaerales bacterium]|nr:alanine racemase [Sedimentisphaerales bacterium]
MQHGRSRFHRTRHLTISDNTTAAIPAAPAKSLANIYEIGPLRLRQQSLKTVKAYISRKNLHHNAALIRKICGNQTKICAVVKANAYGHNAKSVVKTLNANISNCQISHLDNLPRPDLHSEAPNHSPLPSSSPVQYADSFAVSSIEEAEQIFPFALGKNILVTAPLFSGIAPELVKLAQIRAFHCTICSLEALKYLKSILDPADGKINIHLKIETGMGRLGCYPDQAQILLNELKSSNYFILKGVYTHFATADEPELDFVSQQLDYFTAFLAQTKLDDRPDLTIHASNTSAALRFPQARMDMVRCGIGLFGYTNIAENHWDLKPVLRVEAPVIQIKTIPAGQTCGYGRTFRTQRDTCIGIVPVGYADGLFRQLSNRACMRFQNNDLPIIGRISMDLTIIDLTDCPTPHEGMAVTVVDDHLQSPANAENLAKLAGTIPYEILTNIGNRVKRELVD